MGLNKRTYRKVVKTMSELEGYYYRFIIRTKDEVNGKPEKQKFYGDYEVDFDKKTAYITLNSGDKEFLDQTTFYSNNTAFFKEEGQPLDTLRLTEEDYNALFTRGGTLSLFNFGSYNTDSMRTHYYDEKIVFDNIYLPDYDFEKMKYDPYAYEVKIIANKKTYKIETITFKGDFGDNNSGKIYYKYTKVSVED